MPRLNDTRMNFRTGTEISVPSDAAAWIHTHRSGKDWYQNNILEGNMKPQ